MYDRRACQMGTRVCGELTALRRGIISDLWLPNFTCAPECLLGWLMYFCTHVGVTLPLFFFFCGWRNSAFRASHTSLAVTKYLNRHQRAQRFARSFPFRVELQNSQLSGHYYLSTLVGGFMVTEARSGPPTERLCSNSLIEKEDDTALHPPSRCSSLGMLRCHLPRDPSPSFSACPAS